MWDVVGQKKVSMRGTALLCALLLDIIGGLTTNALHHFIRDVFPEVFELALSPHTSELSNRVPFTTPEDILMASVTGTGT